MIFTCVYLAYHDIPELGKYGFRAVNIISKLELPATFDEIFKVTSVPSFS